MDSKASSSREKLQQALHDVQRQSEREIFIYGVTTRGTRNFWQRINDFLIDHSRVPLREKAYFFDLLSTMIRAGIPLNKSLSLLVGKTEHARLRRIIATLHHELEHGRSLSQGLDRFPDVFNEAERGVIRSAESVGHLDMLLGKLAETLERRYELENQLTAALIYPITVVVALVIGIVIIMTSVVPRMRMIFEEGNVALPFATRMLLIGSSFLQSYGWVLLILIIFGIGAFHVYTNSEEGKFSWDFKKLTIPYLGAILRKVYVVRFVENLSVLVESGMPILQALSLTAEGIGNELYRLGTYEVRAQVQEGNRLSVSMNAAPFLFPETVTNILAVGEVTATLGESSRKIGAHFEREIQHTLKRMTTMLGPVLILVIGLFVAFFALAALSPVFSLATAVA